METQAGFCLVSSRWKRVTKTAKCEKSKITSFAKKTFFFFLHSLEVVLDLKWWLALQLGDGKTFAERVVTWRTLN